MNATDYTMDARNALAIRFLQSRPIQIGTSGFLFSVAQDLDNRGSLSKGQRESIESIAAKSNWQPGPALPPSVDGRGERVIVYVTPGCHPGNDFMVELGERYKPLGKIGVRFVHDPVFMAMLDPAPLPLDAPYRLFTSRGAFPLTGTGWARAGFKPRHAESADTLNDVVSPLLSTPDSEYRFRNHLIDGSKRGGGRTWWVFGERQANAIRKVGSKCA
ncbi:hypothetical protein QIH77_03220 [Bradyrhizobium diazoefficiens]|uniref:hypothetical protein n=1 Tax=Bradyrhizobium diazoefficiens TaxID=1355477 RepID=UPI00272C73E9|nr:hypothetical protein [Bradyrhizobium diazoefficiens]WLA74258.1 hypothetical protein QIH77_03220 [Bradyrhizobium diazoefficiens]